MSLLLEFGTRRAQEMDAAIWGTRAAVIGGADATSNVRSCLTLLKFINARSMRAYLYIGACPDKPQ